MKESPDNGNAFDRLSRDVPLGICLKCGGCVASCPVDSIDIEDDSPRLIGECIDCGNCYANCPQVTPDDEIQKRVFSDDASSDVLGHCEAAYSGKTNNHSIEKVAQDGGIVSSILASLLDAGYIDGAIVVDRDSEWRPEPRIVTAEGGIIDCSGTKYVQTDVLSLLKKGVEERSLEDIAVVGTPCQVKGLRSLTTGDNKIEDLSESIKLVIGLFCSESFTYKGLFEEKLKNSLGINPSEISKMDIKGRLIIELKDGSKEELKLEDLEEQVFPPCNFCSDFSAELADISVGGVGSPDGYSTILVRTEIGRVSLEKAQDRGAFSKKDLAEVDPGIELVERLSSKKKESAKETIESYRESSKDAPPRSKKSV